MMVMENPLLFLVKVNIMTRMLIGHILGRKRGTLYFILDEEVEVVPYEIQANMIMIYLEAYGNESEYYFKNNDTSHQLIFNTLDQYGDIDYTKVEIIEKDIH